MRWIGLGHKGNFFKSNMCFVAVKAQSEASIKNIEYSIASPRNFTDFRTQNNYFPFFEIKFPNWRKMSFL